MTEYDPQPMKFAVEQKKLLEDFQKFYYGDFWKVPENYWLHKPVTDATWLGHVPLKFPMDLFVYQEIIWERRPSLIIEFGSCGGGSALFFASICDMIHKGEVVTIDLHKQPKALHQGITYIVSDSLNPELFPQLKKAQEIYKTTMVILDDDHTKDHVLKELELYSQLVTPGQYLVVEDTNLNGHPVFPNFGPGPWEAVHEFLPNHPEFVVDKSREHFGVTYNPDGWLLKIREKD